MQVNASIKTLIDVSVEGRFVVHFKVSQKLIFFRATKGRGLVDLLHFEINDFPVDCSHDKYHLTLSTGIRIRVGRRK